jgi:parallel beta-helix repeat protein
MRSCVVGRVIAGPALSGLYGLSLIGLASPAVAATLTVVTTADSGAGSLRQALTDAAGGGTNSIVFNIPTTDPGFAGGVFTIKPLSQLPNLVNGTTVDATTQTAFTGDSNPVGPEVVVNGSQAGNASGFYISGDDNAVLGFVINGFASGVGVGMSYQPDWTPSRNRIIGNYVGTDASGTSALRNNTGIVVQGYGSPFAHAADNVVQDNLVSGNEISGVVLCDAARTRVAGNRIGTDRTGAVAIPNGKEGLLVTCAGDIETLATENTIAFNGGDGIVDEPHYGYGISLHQGGRFSGNSSWPAQPAPTSRQRPTVSSPFRGSGP